MKNIVNPKNTLNLSENLDRCVNKFVYCEQKCGNLADITVLRKQKDCYRLTMSYSSKTMTVMNDSLIRRFSFTPHPSTFIIL